MEFECEYGGKEESSEIVWSVSVSLEDILQTHTHTPD